METCEENKLDFPIIRIGLVLNLVKLHPAKIMN